MKLSILAFGALSAILAVAQPSKTERGVRAMALTNGELLARGLPVAPPRRLYDGKKRALAPRASTAFSYHTYSYRFCVGDFQCGDSGCQAGDYNNGFYEAEEACQDREQDYDIVIQGSGYTCVKPIDASQQVDCESTFIPFEYYSRN